MMKKNVHISIILLILALIFTPLQTSATVIAPMISYQGRLMDSSSIPLEVQ